MSHAIFPWSDTVTTLKYSFHFSSSWHHLFHCLIPVPKYSTQQPRSLRTALPPNTPSHGWWYWKMIQSLRRSSPRIELYFSLLQCQSSSGSVGKSIWLKFRGPNFESWLDLNVFFLLQLISAYSTTPYKVPSFWICKANSIVAKPQNSVESNIHERKIVWKLVSWILLITNLLLKQFTRLDHCNLRTKTNLKHQEPLDEAFRHVALNYFYEEQCPSRTQLQYQFSELHRPLSLRAIKAWEFNFHVTAT